MAQNEAPKAELMIVGDDWERFLSSLEQLMSLQQKTLHRLKELDVRNEALRQELRDAINLSKVKEIPQRTEAPPQVNKISPEVTPPIDQSTFVVRPYKSRLGTLSRLSRMMRSDSLRKSQSQNILGLASCEKCGHQIGRPSRFCEGCGGDFGALMCPCGRELKPGDKFCDGCGRTIVVE